ncbi:MAG: 4Fe-4S dicluster domain-containing protein [Bryobacterales bacterium]|nr:4Fe-4S dicluster domain-containing protein [Bryobacterales bacterium]MBV9397268.1 4Fe-4S dicluster domain-containing protein [Bryobacterales bacterium]
MAASSADVEVARDAPREEDLSRCVHCGLCLNACPTYRELRVEMDSPRGRIYQMVQVHNGAPITDAYREHIDLCLACRGCETACPSGVQYGRLVEAARAEIEQRVERPWAQRALRSFVFQRLLPSRRLLKIAGAGMLLYQTCGLQKFVRASGMLKLMGRLGEIEPLAPAVETPFFYRHIGEVFPANGERKYRVAFLSGCIANISFARLNEATLRVLQANGCEVTVHAEQTCCGALAVHAGLREPARRQARQNIDALIDGGFDAILTNAGGCGSTLKEYDELLEHDPQYSEKAKRFVSLTKDVNEFLAAIDLNTRMGEVRATVTYQDSCHLAHGQKVRSAPRNLLAAIPGLTLKEMRLADLCCGSAGIYNIVHTEMSMQLLAKKIDNVNATGADVIATANPGCMLQLRAGVEKYGRGQKVAHVVEILDQAYRAADTR